MVNIRYVEAKLRAMPLFRTLQWSWFAVAMTYVYGNKIKKFCIQRLPSQMNTDARYVCSVINADVSRYVDYSLFVCYCIVFMLTVLTIKKDLIRFQVSQVINYAYSL